MPGISSASLEAHRRGASAVMIPVKTSQNFIDPQKWQAFCCCRGISKYKDVSANGEHSGNAFFPIFFFFLPSLYKYARVNLAYQDAEEGSHMIRCGAFHQTHC